MFFATPAFFSETRQPPGDSMLTPEAPQWFPEGGQKITWRRKNMLGQEYQVLLPSLYLERESLRGNISCHDLLHENLNEDKIMLRRNGFEHDGS